LLDLPTLSVALPLAVICALAFSIETALGFGATLISVALGSFVLDLDALLPALAPLNLTLSIYLATRYRAQIDQRFLFTRLLPLMGLGLPIGMLVFASADPSLLKRLFGAFLVVVAAVELMRMRQPGDQQPLGRPGEIAMLLAGGMIHGAFMTGGPMAVYVTGRVLTDKGRYRATLSALWAVLNIVILTSYAMTGRLTATTGGLVVTLVPSIAIGMVTGEVLFRRVSQTLFRGAVFVMLLASGALLMVRG
jgi:uncharacterized membrane protein YfcA